MFNLIRFPFALVLIIKNFPYICRYNYVRRLARYFGHFVKHFLDIMLFMLNALQDFMLMKDLEFESFAGSLLIFS
jgi:hypothetical protein